MEIILVGFVGPRKVNTFMNRLRFYAKKNLCWATPAFVVHPYGGFKYSYTKWDFGFVFLCFEIGFGWKLKK